jgi:hypothetical protein
VPVLLATGLAVSGTFVRPQPAAAAGPKVVVVVGPTHSATAGYITHAKAIAAQARSLGASVTEIYTPRATWARVSAAAQGAKLFVYLGHGSGYPSPYGWDPAKRDGMGLNPVDGVGTTSPVKYYGESRIGSTIRFAPNAVVLLNHLCYASGSGEPGMAEPSWAVARQRVDNYAAGFISAGAGAVIATAYRDVSYDVRAILTGQNMLAAWRANPAYNSHERSFNSTRHAGFVTYLDPDAPSSSFYRALTTKATFTSASPAPAPAPAAFTAITTVTARLRAKPYETSGTVAILAPGTRTAVAAQLVSDSKGRTWAPVKTSSGKTGYVAAWLLRFSGTAVAATNVVLRSSPYLMATRIETVRAGTRVSVLGSIRDTSYRIWLKVKTPSGNTGLMAAWLMRP